MFRSRRDLGRKQQAKLSEKQHQQGVYRAGLTLIGSNSLSTPIRPWRENGFGSEESWCAQELGCIRTLIIELRCRTILSRSLVPDPFIISPCGAHHHTKSSANPLPPVSITHLGNILSYSMPSYSTSPHQAQYSRQPPPRYYQHPAEDDYRMPPAAHQPPRYGPPIMKPGKQVEVRIRGNFWVVGLLVSGLHLVSSVFGQGYDVEYADLSTRETLRSPFHPDDVRPYDG